MNTPAEAAVQQRLFALGDPSYRAFHTVLMPTVDPETVIGIRIPQLRKLAAELAGQPVAADFLNALPHRYYEENNLHGFLIAQMNDISAVFSALDRFLPFVDNWATCDSLRPKVFRRHLPALHEKIKEWLTDEHPYTVRFGMEMRMCFFLDDSFRPEYLQEIADVRSEHYYVNMMIAWFFATALAKQYDAAVGYLEQRRLDPWTHGKAIQKAVESRRLTPEQKTYLVSLKSCGSVPYPT